MNTFVSPTALIILDGWGHSEQREGNAIAQAHPETFTYLWNNYPHALLQASGTAVGLPAGYMGNSEVGHMTIGAGRIIQQPLTIINESIKNKLLCKNPILQKEFKQLPSGRLHILGLLSDGGVHSHIDHLYALLQCAQKSQISEIFVHVFLDGRDVPPQSAEKYLHELSKKIKNTNISISSISGRYYAMDRDNNWQRTENVFDILTNDKVPTEANWQTILKNNYAQNITDEFIVPTRITTNSQIRNEDGIVIFNYRPDRIRQLTSCFLDKKKIKPTWVITMTRYNKTFTNPVLFEKEDIKDTLFDHLEKQNKTIFTIAETEKYAHVTYFFNGGREIKRANETRVLIPSHPEKNYENDPEMSAASITEHVLKSLKNKPCDFYLINYANADMVGHSGNLASTIQAIQCVDKQLKTLYEAFVLKQNGRLIITADHGNAEEMLFLPTKTKKTSHTTNPVPCIVVEQKLKNSNKKIDTQQLAEIAQIIL